MNGIAAAPYIVSYASPWECSVAPSPYVYWVLTQFMPAPPEVIVYTILIYFRVSPALLYTAYGTTIKYELGRINTREMCFNHESPKHRNDTINTTSRANRTDSDKKPNRNFFVARKYQNINLHGTVEQICCGSGFYIIVVDYAAVYAWGVNDSNQLGQISQAHYISNPVEVVRYDSSPVLSVSCGENHTAIIEASGRIQYARTWGSNRHGAVGHGCEHSTNIIASGTVLAAVCTAHGTFVMTDGTIRYFGIISFGNICDAIVTCSQPIYRLLSDEFSRTFANHPTRSHEVVQENIVEQGFKLSYCKDVFIIEANQIAVKPNPLIVTRAGIRHPQCFVPW
jgi:hypothetical protein